MPRPRAYNVKQRSRLSIWWINVQNDEFAGGLLFCLLILLAFMGLVLLSMLGVG